MLEMPFVLYINCIGSYFYSIFQTVTPEGNINALLYYLSYGKLQYKKLVLEDVREKYADNPWGYQPVVIVDDVGQELGINMAFLNYLADIHHINVKVVDFIKDNFNLKKYYLAKVRKQNYCICSVDEYYLPSSERFYRKMHNKHYLLVKNFNYDFSIFEIIDSEKNKVVEIEYQDLENAICKSIYKKKEMYLVDFEEYIDTTDFSCILKRCLRNVNSAEYIQKLRQDIERVSQNCFWNSGYYYNCLFYTTQSPRDYCACRMACSA